MRDLLHSDASVVLQGCSESSAGTLAHSGTHVALWSTRSPLCRHGLYLCHPQLPAGEWPLSSIPHQVFFASYVVPLIMLSWMHESHLLLFILFVRLFLKESLILLCLTFLNVCGFNVVCPFNGSYCDLQSILGNFSESVVMGTLCVFSSMTGKDYIVISYKEIHKLAVKQEYFDICFSANC